MTLSTVRLLSFLIALAATTPALAADEPFVIADASTSPRFMSLDSARGIRTDNGLHAVPVMRSDKQAMENGFMRIDRATLRPIQTFRGTNVIKVPDTTASADSGVTVQRGGQATPQPDAITDLFAPGTQEPAASFTDTLRGRTGARVTHSWPLPASAEQKFSSGYGMRSDPFTGKPAFHGGIDISAGVGTPVLASAEGTVTKVASVGGDLGNYIAIQHRDGTESYYGHLSLQKVRIGQHVMQGQQVGAVGSTGRSTGPHLDYRIKRGDETFNPLTVLRAPLSVDTHLASR